MNLILLAGKSAHNKEWLYCAESKLADNFGVTYAHEYSHWDQPDAQIDLVHEARRLAEIAPEMAPYRIFAKSAGAVLAVEAIANGQLSPEGCLFVGFPLTIVLQEQAGLMTQLRAISVPVTVIQNQDDPYGTYDDVKEYFDEVQNPLITIICTPGNDHAYDEIAEYATRLAV